MNKLFIIGLILAGLIGLLIFLLEGKNNLGALKSFSLTYDYCGEERIINLTDYLALRTQLYQDIVDKNPIDPCLQELYVKTLNAGLDKNDILSVSAGEDILLKSQQKIVEKEIK